MSELSVEQIDQLLAGAEPCCLIEVLQAKGSTPRNAGAMMVVSPKTIHGTIGGGSAEWLAIQEARKFIEKAGGGGGIHERQTITLGPEIDQCCGGSLEVSYRLLEQNLRDEIVGRIAGENSTQVLIFGAGHTGLALANALAPLAMNIRIVDTRPEYLEKTKPHKLLCLAMPEEAVRESDGGAVFIVTTHDHSLDFLITAEILARDDAKYVGMIGSSTKRAVLKSWMADNGYDADTIDNLHCPIGGTHVKNKQPEVIAAMSVAEILTALD